MDDEGYKGQVTQQTTPELCGDLEPKFEQQTELNCLMFDPSGLKIKYKVIHVQQY